jgi:deoxyribose-phosphate aldolase
MKETVAGRAKVKASGGIRDLKTLMAMLEAGADRIGTSASVKIMQEWQRLRECCS